MTREEALSALQSPVPAVRLGAARYLQFWALAEDIPDLREAIARESVGWVSRALESALVRLGDKRAATVDLDDLRQEESTSSADLAAIARAQIANTVVHELEPIVGVIEYYASSELGDIYPRSMTRLHVERLAALLRAIETLGRLSHTPSMERIDVAKLIAAVVEAERASFAAPVRVEGVQRLIVETDPSLLRLIVGNGVKNACEAVAQVSDRVASVSVLFGASDRELWVTILDDGVGLPSGSSASLFEMGTSTKEDHIGMGLALSGEAARALGGTLQLSSAGKGARLELVVPVTGVKR